MPDIRTQYPENDDPTDGSRRKRNAYIVLIVVIAAGSIAYRLIVRGHLEQTSLLFIGIPTLLGILTALSSPPKTATGTTVRVTVLALLLSGPLLGEGFICILMATPLFLLVAVTSGVFADRQIRKNRRHLSLGFLVLIPFCFEGTTPYLSFPRDESVSVQRVIEATPLQIERALSRPPLVTSPLPAFLRLKFPMPTEARGTGLGVNDTRTIHFAGGEGHPGDLTLRVVDHQPGRILFAVEEDKSTIAHWLDWRSSDVRYEAVDSTHTRVTWKIYFTRRLDPAWYFGPWERYAVSKAADYLITANAVPTVEER
jgi:hypothetical protein